jgi:hypothetical protein
VPSVISGRAITILLVTTAAPTARRIFAPPVLLLVGGFGLGLLLLICPSRLPHILGENLLAGNASVVVVVVVCHCHNITLFLKKVKRFLQEVINNFGWHAAGCKFRAN